MLITFLCLSLLLLLNTRFSTSLPQPDPVPRVTCYSASNPPRSKRPYVKPKFEDALTIRRQIYNLDPHETSREPLTWALKGDFPEGTIDVELPRVVDLGTCRVIIAMRPGIRGVKDALSITPVAESAPDIAWYCSHEFPMWGLGGYTDLGSCLRVTVVGKTPSITEGSDAEAGNSTLIMPEIGNWTTGR